MSARKATTAGPSGGLKSLGQQHGFFAGFHEGTGAELYIEHKAVEGNLRNDHVQPSLFKSGYTADTHIKVQRGDLLRLLHGARKAMEHTPKAAVL